MGEAQHAGPVREFRVVCRHPSGTAYILHRSAADAAGAMQSARAAGHDAQTCIPFGLSRKDENLLIRRWREGLRFCPECGYDQSGSAPGASMVCPECGLGAAPSRQRAPKCPTCGYILSGISIGSEPTRCPECGNLASFVR